MCSFTELVCTDILFCSFVLKREKHPISYWLSYVPWCGVTTHWYMTMYACVFYVMMLSVAHLCNICGRWMKCEYKSTWVKLYWQRKTDLLCEILFAVPFCWIGIWRGQTGLKLSLCLCGERLYIWVVQAVYSSSTYMHCYRTGLYMFMLTNTLF